MRTAGSPDTMGRYFHDLHRYPLLSPEEEHTLAVEYRRTGRTDLAQRLATAHLRLVVKIAREYRWSGQSLLDLIEEGNLGLLQAVTKYDPERGVKLSSYAAWWIRAAILHFVVANWRLVRIGTTVEQRRAMFRLRRERAALERDGRAVDIDELAARIGVDAAELPALEQHLASSEVRLDAPVSPDGPDLQSRVDLLAAPADERPDELAERREYRDLASRTASEFEQQLVGRDRKLFRLRWLAEDQPTLQEVGDRFGISRERARQLEKRILGRFQTFAERRLDAAPARTLTVGSRP